MPTGISLTFAAGTEQNAGDGSYGYVKLGYEHEFFEFGSTAFSVDYYEGSDLAAEHSNGNTVGIAAVQNIDPANLQLWLLWRYQEYDDSAANYKSGQATFGGARFRF